jgi:hypothetical protein
VTALSELLAAAAVNGCQWWSLCTDLYQYYIPSL